MALPDEYWFLKGGGNLARRIAAHDWASTALGPIEEWPESLKRVIALMLPSPVPMVLLWGPDGVMIYNDAYSPIAGGRDSQLLGSRVLEGWGEVAEFNANIMRVAMAGGTLSYRDHELTLYRHGQAEQVWMDLDYSPVRGADGEPVGVLAVVVETTEAHHARTALEDSERRLRFLDALGRAMADSRDAEAVLAIATRMTADHLGASNCAYADMDPDQDGFTIRGNWHAEDVPSILGHYSLADFGERAVRDLHAGRPLVIRDNRAELEPQAAQSFRDIGIGATICMPLLTQGRLSALMAVHDRDARDWNDYDLAVMREVAERSWAHIQRVGAEGTLRASEAHHRQILDSAIDYGIVATDLNGCVTLWNRGATEMLGWDEDEMIGQPMDVFFTEEDRAAGRPAEKRRETLAHGRSHDARRHLRKSGERFWGLSEMVPLRGEGGQPIGFVKLIRDRTAEYEAEQALRRSEERLRRAQAAGGVGLFSVDIATNIISTTPEFCRIFGLGPTEEIAAAEVEQLVLPEDRQVVSTLKGRRSGEGLLDVEYRIRRPDTGEVRIIARKGEFERDENGRPVRMVGVVQDATERRRIQTALEVSEAQFSALAQNMPNQVWTASADGTLDWFNDQIYSYTGVARGTLDGDRWTRFIHPEDFDAAAERWAAAVRSGAVYETELRLRDERGDYRWFLARALPLTDHQGRITAWVGTNTEIDAQKRAEEASAQDRDRLWSISQDLMLVCDFSGVITAVNPSGQRLLGWSEEEMVGTPLTQYLHPDDQEATAAELSSLGAGSTTFAFENRYRTKDDDYRLLAWTAVPDGGRIHAVGRDVTEQREVEEALRQSHKMEAVGQLTGGIAHDFNNLLQGITGSLDILGNRLAQGRTDDVQRWLTGAKNSAERAAALTHRLLAFSRRQPLDPRPVRANPLVSSMEDLLRRTLGEQVDLELVLAGGLWLTRCDPNQLESAILNLAINARDAMPEGGKLTIETCNAHLDNHYAALQRDVKPGQYVCICVTDTGTGMDKETIARAFEPFFTTKPIGQGTGLGLSMIYGFTRQSEGYARIYSEPGEGTTIKLYLPRHRGEERAEEPAGELAEAPKADDGEVVVVVEDEPVVRGLIVDVLNELGYQAIEAQDGREGLEVLRSDRRIDLLVTDIGLPGLNGREVAAGGREVRPGLKVLFMTGYAENAALASGFLEPGMAMITKPFAMDMLASRIREILTG
ncbi:hybrid sensor histidine kinase/response regulator [Altererythrobacter sp. B11]|uniref:PAS domain S-box protein n=1 Tax=Altererythrobacter sp. B11 TaxID=2060312 RepID=UPI000DC6E8EC|nr:PAS domain S-box protein [Altererythrobacter sp. B11]BBC73455.1 hybrid sensor histidine kinase/response regulator [Altererythrobacter sp. B11]